MRVGRKADYENSPAAKLPEYAKLVQAWRAGDRNKEVARSC